MSVNWKKKKSIEHILNFKFINSESSSNDKIGRMEKFNFQFSYELRVRRQHADVSRRRTRNHNALGSFAKTFYCSFFWMSLFIFFSA